MKKFEKMDNKYILYLLTALSYPLGFVLAPLIAGLGSYGGDPAGRGMAYGFTVLLLLGGWILFWFLITTAIACFNAKQQLGPTLAISFLSIVLCACIFTV